MKLTINLATRRYVNLRQLNAALAACLVLFAALAIFNVQEIAGKAAELARIERLSAASGPRVGGVPVSEAQLKGLSTRIRFANAVIEKKTVNWLTVLDRLEEVVPSGVALTQIQPDLRLQQLKIAGVARSFANLRELLDTMERSKNFSEVYLLSQSEAKVGLTQHGIVFDVACKVDLR